MADTDFKPDYLSTPELERLLAECENFSKVGILRLMNMITADIPGATTKVRAWLEAAEAESNPKCDVCGQPGNYHDEVVLCPEHEPPDLPDPPDPEETPFDEFHYPHEARRTRAMTPQEVAELYVGEGEDDGDDDGLTEDFLMNHQARNGPY